MMNDTKTMTLADVAEEVNNIRARTAAVAALVAPMSERLAAEEPALYGAGLILDDIWGELEEVHGALERLVEKRKMLAEEVAEIDALAEPAA